MIDPRLFLAEDLPSESIIKELIEAHIDHLKTIAEEALYDFRKEGITVDLMDQLQHLNQDSALLAMAIEAYQRTKMRKERDDIARLN